MLMETYIVKQFYCSITLFRQLVSYLQVTVAHSFLSEGNKLFRALLGHVHQISSDCARSSVHWRLPQDDQGVTSDLTEVQVVGWAWRFVRTEHKQAQNCNSCNKQRKKLECKILCNDLCVKSLFYCLFEKNEVKK